MELIIIILIIIFLFYKNGTIKGMIEELKYPFSDDPEGKYKKSYQQRIAQRKSRNLILFFVEVFIMFIFIIGIVIYDYFDDSTEKNLKLTEEIKGLYICKDENGNSETLTLDSICYFSSDINKQCRWKVEKDIVKITFSVGNSYDGYKKVLEYKARIKDGKLYIKDKICEKF